MLHSSQFHVSFLLHAADLIMLGLATHEPYFTILREEFKLIQRRPCEICDQYGHDMQDCTGAAREKKGEVCLNGGERFEKIMWYTYINKQREALAM